MFYALGRLLCRWFLKVLGSPLIIGKENIPRTGPAIVVANHTSLLDGFVLAAFWPGRVTFLSAAYLFRLPVVGTFLRMTGAIPVQSEGNGAAGIKTALRVLQRGGTLALFPEGRVSPDSRLCIFQTGWAYLALKTGATILPVAIKGTGSVLPVHAAFPRRRKIHVQVAAPWTPEKIQHPRQETLAAMNMRLMNQMEKLLNEMEAGTKDPCKYKTVDQLEKSP
ncbi:MAG: 1-acyl-sn-glycerol-3-phosphate acyltransferase [Firmicutes bacterium]|nr:1-acyl-sn-glycerol-3-phosphate acyltransferase [Bacillota bacterium]